MIKFLLDEAIRLNIIINGNKAQKELFELESANRKLADSNKYLYAERTKLIAQGKKNTEEYKNLSAEIKANNTSISANKTRMSDLQKEIGITSLTMSQLSKEAAKLRILLNHVIPGSEDAKRYEAELFKINKRLAELKGKSSAAESTVSKLATGFNKYAVLGATAVASLTGMAISIQKVIDYNGKLSDSQSDVMKTTGMTKKEVDELTKSFGLLKTRTQRIDLLKIAEEGGRIGVAKEEIGKFVEVMNKANVALGDSFTGGVEEVASKLGKLKFLFKETRDIGIEETYNAIGSAINDLGASGNATENNITEFTTRIGSLPDALKPAIGDALALGAAFEESGIEAEISARAYNIFLKQAATETKKFANVMGISQKEVEKMINDDPLEFFLTFSETLNGLDLEGVKMAQTLEYLGINADGANKVIGAAANNTDRFRQLMDLSNQSMLQGTSLINEYDIKNNNLAATLEKIKKTVTGWYSSETFVKWLESSVRWLSEFIGASDEAETSAESWKEKLVFLAKIIAVVTAAIVTDVAWKKLTVLWINNVAKGQILETAAKKADLIITNLGIARTQLWAATKLLFTLRLKEANAAFKLFAATMNTTPWGLVLTALVTVFVAFKAFSKEVDKSTASQKMFNDIQKEVNESIAKEKASLDQLLLVARDETLSKEERLKAILQINKLSPEYLGNLRLETISTLEATQAIDAYVKMLRYKATEQALANKRTQITQNILDQEDIMTTESKGRGINDDYTRKFANASRKKGILQNQLDELDKKSVELLKKTIDEKKYIRDLDLRNLDVWYTKQIIKANGNKKEIDKINKEWEKKKKEIYKNRSTTTTPGTPPDTPPGGGGFTPPNKSADTSGKSAEDILKEQNAKLLELQRQHKDNELAMMVDGYVKERALENENHKRKLADLEARKKTEPYAVKEIDALIEDEKRMHNTRLDIITTNAEIKREQDLHTQFEREAQMRETAFYNELGQMDLNEDERKKKIDEFQKNELDQKVKYLETNLAKLKELISISNSDESDIIISDAQTQELLDKIATLENALAKLNDEKEGNNANNKNPKTSELKGTASGAIDILGFKLEDWEATFTNLDTTEKKLQAVMMGIQGLANAYALYDQYRSAAEARLLQQYTVSNNKQKDVLKKRLDSGQISQEEYSKRVEKLDNALEERKFQIDLAQAKRQRTMAVAQIAINTAQAIMSIWAHSPDPTGITQSILSGIILVLGAVQAGIVLKQPLPVRGAEDGFYPVQREQDGKVFRARYGGNVSSGMVNRPTYFLTGENNKPEMILDSKVYSQMNPNIRQAMHSEVARIKGFENGYYPKENKNNSSSNDMLLQAVLLNIQQNTDLLQNIMQYGIEAKVSNKDLKSMKHIEEGIKNYNTLTNRTKP